MFLRNTLFNLIGFGIPLAVAVATIPALLEALGTARFGLLTLIWAVVSYFGLFDLGLGRTLTLQISVAESRGDHAAVGRMVGTALWTMALLGLATGLVLALCAGPGVDLLASVPDRDETVWAVRAMAVALPAIILTSGLRGILEARHAFGVLNLIRIPLGIFTFVGPLFAVWLGAPHLDVIAWVLAGGRYLALFAHAFVAMRALSPETGKLRFDRSELRPLFTIGGWLTVSNIVSPLMGYADRFMIGGLVSPSAVAFYATPYEIVTKLWIVPGALTAVLFPTFASQLGAGSRPVGLLFHRSVNILYLVLLPVCTLLALFAHELLALWIDSAFADNSAPLLRIFAVGMLINCLAHIPFTFLQSAGRPRTTAYIHLAEAVPFLLALWFMTNALGPIGAALAWLGRLTVDTILMFWFSAPLIGLGPADLARGSVFARTALAALAFSGLLLEPLWLRVCWLGVVAAICGALTLRSLPALGKSAELR